jgi:hypothetical protein
MESPMGELVIAIEHGVGGAGSTNIKKGSTKTNLLSRKLVTCGKWNGETMGWLQDFPGAGKDASMRCSFHPSFRNASNWRKIGTRPPYERSNGARADRGS